MVSLQTPPNFGGMFYVAGSFSSLRCRHAIPSFSSTSSLTLGGSGATPPPVTTSYFFPYEKCETTYHQVNSSKTMKVIVSDSPVLITSRTRAYLLQCPTSGWLPPLPGANLLAPGDVELVAATSQPIHIHLTISDSANQPVRSARLGEMLKLRVHATGGYDVLVTVCEARAGFSDISLPPMQLTDESGCSLDPSIISHFKPSPLSHIGVEAYFEAFTFPTAETVRFNCHSRVCLNRCPLMRCPRAGGQYSRGKRATSPNSSPTTMTDSAELVVQNYLKLPGESLDKTYYGRPLHMLVDNFILQQRNKSTDYALPLLTEDLICMDDTVVGSAGAFLILLFFSLLVADIIICFYPQCVTPKPGDNTLTRVLHSICPRKTQTGRAGGNNPQSDEGGAAFQRKYIRNPSSLYGRRVSVPHAYRPRGLNGGDEVDEMRVMSSGGTSTSSLCERLGQFEEICVQPDMDITYTNWSYKSNDSR